MRYLPCALLLLASGCSTPAPAAAPPASTAPGVPAQVAATPAPAREASAVEGVVRYFGAPLAGATVTARLPGKADALATATARADGTFTLILPEAIAPGTVIALVGEGGGHRLANLASAPARGPLPAARRVFEAASPVVLDAARTTALMVLAPRLLATLQLGTDAARQAALASLAAAAAALDGQSNANLLAPTRFDQVVSQVLDAAGRVVQGDAAQAAIASAIPTAAVEALTTQADALARVIRDAVTAGHDRPDPTLTGPLAVGPQVAVEVFPDASGPDTPNTLPTGGSGGGGASDTVPDGSATIDLSATPADGSFGQPPAPVSGEAR